MLTLAVRLTPDQDLKAELDRIAAARSIEAACILTCAGSLRKAVLRFANQNEAVELTGFFEIVSLTGTLSRHGSHFHIAIADSEGKTWGAHLLEGSAIYTTAEIVIGILPGTHFLRTQDPRTSYPELEIFPVS
jgi:hypothetical protein